MSLFLDKHLPLPDSGTWKVSAGDGDGQKLVVAARLDRVVRSIRPVMDTRLEAQFEADVDGDSELQNLEFARVPQVLDIEAHSSEIRVINCHLKSKYVPNGERLWGGSRKDRRTYIRSALAARRRISAEAFRIRDYLDEVFNREPGRLLLLAGDLNDGPGFDYFERRYLTHSVIDVVFGSVLRPAGRLVHPLIQEGGHKPVSAYFDDFVEGIDDKPLLLDHVGLSPALAGWRVDARIAHAEFNAQALPSAVNDRERFPSDHRPILVTLSP